MEGVRVDVWLWSVRLFKTRSAATDACRGGHVKVNGAAAKAATPIKVGDWVAARAYDRDRVVEVAQLVGKRVGAPIAATCLVDHTPALPPRDLDPPVFARDPASGRPTKRDRRQLDRFRSQ